MSNYRRGWDVNEQPTPSSHHPLSLLNCWMPVRYRGAGRTPKARVSSAVELLFSGTDGIEWMPVCTEPSDPGPVVAPPCTETIGSLRFVDFDVSREDGFNSTCRDVTLRGLPLLVNEDVFSGCDDVSFTAYITLFA